MAEELDGFEVALLDAYREATAPDPRVEDALLARVLAEVRGEQLDAQDEAPADLEPHRERSRDARPFTSTAIAITAFAAGVALTWGLRGSVLQALPAPAPSSAPMQQGEGGQPRPYVDSAALPTCVDRTADEVVGEQFADLGTAPEPTDEWLPPRPDQDPREPSEDEPSEPDDESVPAGQDQSDHEEVEERWIGSPHVVAMRPVSDDEDDTNRGRRSSSTRGSGGWTRWSSGSSTRSSRTRPWSGSGEGGGPGDSQGPSGRPSAKPPRDDSPDPREPSPEPGPQNPGSEPPPEPTPKPEVPPDPGPEPEPEPGEPNDSGADGGGTGGNPYEEVPPDAQCDYEFEDCVAQLEMYCVERPVPEVCYEVRFNSCSYAYESCLQGGYPQPDYDPCIDYLDACFREADYVCTEYPDDPQYCMDMHTQCEAIMDECYAAYEVDGEQPNDRWGVEVEEDP